MINETPAMIKIGSILDYLLHMRGVNRCWTLKAPCKGVDEGDRLAALLVRSRFALALHEMHATEPLTLEEFAFHCEWQEVIRLSQFIWEGEVRKMAVKKIHEFKHGRETFKGPHGDQSEWAGIVRNWYADYLKTGVL